VLTDALGHVSGWGLVNAVKATFGLVVNSGDLVWTATPSGKLTVAIDTLVNPTMVGTDVPGMMDHFDPSQPYSWPAVRWAGTYAGPTETATPECGHGVRHVGIPEPDSWDVRLVPRLGGSDAVAGVQAQRRAGAGDTSSRDRGYQRRLGRPPPPALVFGSRMICPRILFFMSSP
jgi:hypothetical protein